MVLLERRRRADAWATLVRGFAAEVPLDTLTIFGVLLLGGIAAVVGVRTILLAWSMQSWPSVEGEVRSSRALTVRPIGVTRGTEYRPELLYAFTVDGIEYTGSRRKLFTMQNSDPQSAANVAARYPVGQRVTVYYDPRNPRESILNRETALPWGVLITGAGIGLCAACASALRHKEVATEPTPRVVPQLPGLILAFAFIIIGAVAASVALIQRKRAFAMQSWSTTDAEVRSSGIEITGNGFYKPQVEYTFTVGSRQIVSRRRALFAGASSNRAWADTVVSQYPVGGRVTVYYDPVHPDECVLDRTHARALATLFPMVGLAFSAIGLVCLDYFTR
jgi:Protein of unknown function (DUF3592)